MAELKEADKAAAQVVADDLIKQLRARAAGTSPLLTTYVEECERNGLLKTFAETDRLAMNMQSSHRSNARWAITLGGLAALVGLFALHAEPRDAWRWAVWGVELALFLGSAAFVAKGLLSFRKEAWLTIRYRAERYRLLIYGLLIDPALSTAKKPGPGGWREFFGPAMQGIAILPREDPQTLATAESFPTVPSPQATEGAPPSVVRDVGQFYRDTIMNEQIRYFRKNTNVDRWVVSPRVPSVAFALIAIFVCVHLAFAFIASREPDFELARILDSAFLEGSLVLVILWAGLRNWLSANEFSRNAFRAQARLNALVEGQSGLDEALKVQRITNSGVDTWRVFATLSLCQAQLEAEQREWLRLMIDTEWY